MDILYSFKSSEMDLGSERVNNTAMKIKEKMGIAFGLHFVFIKYI